MSEVIQLGNCMTNGKRENPNQGRVYDQKGIAPCLTCMGGGNLQPMIIEPNMVIVAMRGRNPDNPSDRTPGIELEQRLEPNSEGICNTLTTVQKDNLVLENKNGFYEQAIKTAIENNAKEGDIVDAYNQKILTDGISPTITTRPEGKKTAILPVVKNNKIEKVGQISNEGSQCGTVVSTEGLYPTISAGCHGYANPHIAQNYRIRKLTPRECFRLMNVEEEQFNRAEKVVSNSQLYKIAGNAIVVSVLCALFSQLNIQGIKPWNELNDEERYKIVNKGCVRNSPHSSPKPCGVYLKKLYR